VLNFAAYVFAFVAYYAVGYAFQFGAVAINSAPSTSWNSTLNHFLIGNGLWGFLGGKGFFMTGPRTMPAAMSWRSLKWCS